MTTEEAAGEGPDAELTLDRLMGGRIAFCQPRRGYRAAIDPILLAAAVPAQSGQRVLDVGTGAGAAALCLARRVPGCRITGLEAQSDLARIARWNARENGFADDIEIIEGDLLASPERLRADPFDHVMTNPPFLEYRRATLPPNAAKIAANVEGGAGIEAWIRFCAGRLRRGGVLTLIHRADRLDAVLAALRGNGLGGIIVIPLWPRRDVAPAKRVILRARRGIRAGLTLAPGMVLHEADGRFTEAAEAVLRGGEAIIV